MGRKTNCVSKKARRPKMKLGLPDLDQAKSAVLNRCAHRNSHTVINIFYFYSSSSETIQRTKIAFGNSAWTPFLPSTS